MKKHLKKLTVLVLVAVQLVSAFAFGASAAVTPYAQNIYRVNTEKDEMQLDGKIGENEPWDKVGAIPMYLRGTTDKNKFSDVSNVKLMWEANAEGKAKYLHVLLTIKDTNGYTPESVAGQWSADSFQLAVDETGTSEATSVGGWASGATLYRTGGKSLQGGAGNSGGTTPWASWYVNRDDENDLVTVEAKITLTKTNLTTNSTISFNAMAQLGKDAGGCDRYLCNGESDINIGAKTFADCKLSGAYAKDIFVPDAYTVYNVDPATVTLDGAVTKKEPWDKLSAMPLYNMSTDASKDMDDGASVRLMWGKDDTGVYVYTMLRYNDKNTSFNGTNWAADGCQFAIDENGAGELAVIPAGKTGTLYRTGLINAKNSEAVATLNTCEYFVTRTTVGAYDEVVVEAKLKLNTADVDANSVIGFNVLAQNYISDSSAMQCSVNKQNVDKNAPTFAKCTLSGELAKEVSNFISPEATPTRAPVLYGYQLRNETADKFDVRFVSTIDNVDYSEVGYIFNLEKWTGTEQQKISFEEAGEECVSTRTVYKSLNYTDERGKAQQVYAKGRDCFVAVAITDIGLTSDVDYLFGTVTPYGKDENGNTYYGITYSLEIIDGKTVSIEKYTKTN